jgi:tRNA dimethylallyltransferase
MSSSDVSAGASRSVVLSEAPALERSEGKDLLIPVICGPTAAGKSAIATWLAERHDVVIISADSRQVYRGLDIGTGKPDVAERKRVPHVGIDVVEPTDRYSAAAWAAMAHEAILQASSSKLQAVVVGGTGFYISTLFKPLWNEPELDPVARAAVQEGLAELDIDELRRWCTALDPARARFGRAQLLRAVEVALLTGERLSDLHKTRARPAAFTPRYLLVDPGMTLASSIATRASAMFAAGWEGEVRGLMKSVPENAPAWNATGYRVVRRLALGELGAAEALERVTIETRQFAKRQRTWFRNQLEDSHVQRLAPNAPGWEDVVERWFTRSAESPSTRHQALGTSR